MGATTGISWTDHTFNPWVGCQAISEGCDRCYAGNLVARWGGDFAVRRRTTTANWRNPLRWNRQAAAAGVRRKVFCASLADVFDNQVPDKWRADLWELIRICPALDWQLLTKRPQNIRKMLPPGWAQGWPNVWLGTTAEDEHFYRQRWGHVAAIPAAVRFLSYEPALGPMADLGLGRVGAPDWVIVGGESGGGARMMRRDWAADVLHQCAAAGTAVFFKQVGSNRGTDYGRDRDWPDTISGKGDNSAQWPPELFVQQFPAAV